MTTDRRREFNEIEHGVEQRTVENLYPAPLAGVEPLSDRLMDPDGEEESVVDAEVKAREDRETLAGTTTSMEIDMTSARLDERPGTGLLREVRDAEGGIAKVPGSWRPGANGTEIGAWSAGDSLVFEGSLHRADGSVEHVKCDVTITSIGDYTTEDGERLELVNFEAAVPVMLEHAASDDGALPPG